MSVESIKERYSSLVSERDKCKVEKIEYETQLKVSKEELEKRMKELNEEFEVSSIEEAEKLLETMTTDIENELKECEELLKKFEDNDESGD